MNLECLATVLLVAVVALAWRVSAPASSASRRQDEERRLRFAARNPERVNAHDVECLLAREISQDVADFISELAQVRSITPTTMWAFISRFNAQDLVLAIGSDLGEPDLRRCLERGTLPDRESLALFASCNGLPVAWLTGPSRTS